MARPREFDEEKVLWAAVECFWEHGYEATSTRDLAGRMGLTNASLYNAFGDKKSLYRQALDRYAAISFSDRVRRFEGLPPRAAIEGFFREIIDRSLKDRNRRGCMLVNSALEVAPHDRDLKIAVSDFLHRAEDFFRRRAEEGQADGTIGRSQTAEDIGRHLLGVLLGMRVVARTRPERALLEGMLRPALAILDV